MVRNFIAKEDMVIFALTKHNFDKAPPYNYGIPTHIPINRIIVIQCFVQERLHEHSHSTYASMHYILFDAILVVIN